MIYIITHKELELPQIDGYKTLLVGGVNHPELQNKYLCDCTGDNISAKNNSYCELTGLYWMWKNTTDDIVGLVHYRRFFVKYKYLLKFRTVYLTLGNRYYEVLSTKDIMNKLSKCDLIVARDSGEWLTSNKRSFQKTLGNNNMSILDNVLKYRYSNYYATYSSYLNEDVLISKNMFIGKRDIINAYCEWIFAVLEDIEDVHYEKYGELYSNRELGYFAELLFGVWLKKNKINYQFCDYENIFETENELYSRYVPIYKFPKFCYQYVRTRIMQKY